MRGINVLLLISYTWILLSPRVIIISSLFHHGSDTAYLLLYVDYIWLVTSSDVLRKWIIAQLKIEFPMSDLAP